MLAICEGKRNAAAAAIARQGVFYRQRVVYRHLACCGVISPGSLLPFRTFRIMPHEFDNYSIDAQTANQPLSQALRMLLPQLSWSQAKNLVTRRRVQINGNLCLDETRRVQLGDVVRISRESLPAPISPRDIRIVYRDEQLVVVDKPAGVTTLRHRAEQEWTDRRKQRQATLDEMVDTLLGIQPPPKQRSSKKSSGQVRAVHRLDRDTSGLLVFARTPAAEVELIRQFKKHTVERAYLALAHGVVTEQTIETRLVRNRGDGLRGSTSDPHAAGAERAVTHVRPLESLPGYTVVECRLETGRTHQIRIHLSERGHMLCGEKTYCTQDDTSGAQRQMLHAAVLGFIHPTTNEELQFISPLPKDMAKVLEQLRSS